jgi:hypothetical protein
MACLPHWCSFSGLGGRAFRGFRRSNQWVELDSPCASDLNHPTAGSGGKRKWLGQRSGLGSGWGGPQRVRRAPSGGWGTNGLGVRPYINTRRPAALRQSGPRFVPGRGPRFSPWGPSSSSVPRESRNGCWLLFSMGPSGAAIFPRPACSTRGFTVPRFPHGCRERLDPVAREGVVVELISGRIFTSPFRQPLGGRRFRRWPFRLRGGRASYLFQGRNPPIGSVAGLAGDRFCSGCSRGVPRAQAPHSRPPPANIGRNCSPTFQPRFSPSESLGGVRRGRFSGGFFDSPAIRTCPLTVYRFKN